MSQNETKLVDAGVCKKMVEAMVADAMKRPDPRRINQMESAKIILDAVFEIVPGFDTEAFQEQCVKRMKEEATQIITQQTPSCDVCKVGFLSTGFNNRELDSNEFLREVQRDPIMTQRYFHRYKFCPVCAAPINWDDEVEL